MRGRIREDSGLVAVIVAVFSVVMFALAALVVDLGVAREIKRDAQTSADAAALAGAGELYTDAGTLQADEAIGAVKDSAAENFGTTPDDWSSCSTTLDPGWSQSAGVVSSGTTCIAFYTPPDALDAEPEKIQVVLPTAPADVLFGGLIGYEGREIGALAQASVISSAIPPCAFCILGPETHGVQDGELEATGGDIRSNGSMTVGPNGHVTSDREIFVEGSVTSPANFSPTAQSMTGNVADPLATMELPTIPSGYPVKTQPCGGNPSTNGPGIYFTVTGYASTCTLLPGLYVIAGPVDASVTVNATAGVTLYFVCRSGSTITPCSASTHPSNRGELSVSGAMTITAPTSGPTKGLALVYDRANTSPLVPRDQALTVTGTIYGPSVTMSASGSDCSTQDSLIVVRDISLTGNDACLKTRYIAAQNVPQSMGQDGIGLSK